MLVGLFTYAIDRLAFLGKAGLLVDFVVGVAKIWRAYLSGSTNAANLGATAPLSMAETALVADPWKNANGVVIATSVEDLAAGASC